MSLKGLVIRQPWIGMILRGEKTWEMRSTPCRHRGPIALIEKGSGTVVGMAELVDDFPPLNENDLRSAFDRHRIPPDQIGDALRRGWVGPWVLAKVSRLQQPVPYKHTSGGSWVNLSADEEAAVLGKNRAGPCYQRAISDTGSTVTAEHTAMAHRVLRSLSHGPSNLKIPADASTSIRRRGNKLYIDVEWDDGLPSLQRKSSKWAEAIGIFAALVAMISMSGFMIHFALGVVSSSISAVGSFKWMIPMFISTLIATAFGQGHLLEDAFRKR